MEKEWFEDESRKLKWPTVEEAMRRITVLTGDQAETDMAARSLIVLMRELGRVTAENADLRRTPPLPPTQSEEETAQEIVCKVMHAEFKDHNPEGPDEPTQLKDAIAAALRQRADEATRAEREACADWLEERDLPADIVSAIRARITP